MLKRKITTVNKRLAALKTFCTGIVVIFTGLSFAFFPKISQAEEVTLALENAEIRELVRWAAEHIDKTIILHPNVKGRVSVLAGEPISREDAYQVFLSVLQVHGFAIVETDSAIKVIPEVLAKHSGVPLADDNFIKSREDLVVRIIKVKNVGAGRLVALLRPLVPQVGYLAAYPQSNALIIADRAGNIDQLIRIIHDIDRVGRIDIEVLTLEFANAREVMEVIDKLITDTDGNIGRPATVVRSGKGTTRGNEGIQTQEIKFAADERSNSIIMAGDPISRQQVRNLVKHLDQPLSGEGNTQVIYVRYANAADIVPILQGVSGSIQKTDKDQPFDTEEISIQVSEENNALIITAPPSLLNTMKGVVKKLDIRRRQVLVEAVIVEVNDDVLNDLGIQWTTSVPDDGVFGGFSAIPGSLPTPTPPDLGVGLTLGYFSGDSLRALIRALESDSSANILSTPTIVTLDNEEAEILVGSNVPFITGSSTGESSPTSNPFQTIVRQDIGVTLRVKPRINEYNSMTLDLEQTVESITSSVVDTADIVTNKRNIKTRVLLENDQVLVLGGLIRDELMQIKSQVPFLGNIPGLGRLFKRNSTQVVKNNLMVFIHPVILSDRKNTDGVTYGKYNEMRDRQIIYNNNADVLFKPENPPLLPEVKPGVSTPEVDQSEPFETNTN